MRIIKHVKRLNDRTSQACNTIFNCLVSENQIPFSDTDAKKTNTVSMGRLCKSSKSARKARLLIIYRGKVNQHAVSRSFRRHAREFPRGRFACNRPPVRSHSQSAGKYRRYGRSVMLCKERGIETNVSKRYVTAKTDLPGLRKTFIQGLLIFSVPLSCSLV